MEKLLLRRIDSRRSKEFCEVHIVLRWNFRRNFRGKRWWSGVFSILRRNMGKVDMQKALSRIQNLKSFWSR